MKNKVPFIVLELAIIRIKVSTSQVYLDSIFLGGKNYDKDLFYVDRNKTLFWNRVYGTGNDGEIGKRSGE